MKVISISILAILLLVSFWGFMTQIPAADEMIFIRITEHLPAYQTHVTWWTLDGKSDPTLNNPADADYLMKAYETKWWIHPELANYLVWPMVKLLYDSTNPTTIIKTFYILRFIAWLILAGCIYATYRIVKKKQQGWKLVLSLAPFLIFTQFFTEWGNNWFYNDIFMLLFLAIAILLRESKYRTWIYIPLACMVATKNFGFLFLIPFVVENHKTAWCGLALVPYLIESWIHTGDPLYAFNFYLMVRTFGANWDHIPNTFEMFKVLLSGVLYGSQSVTYQPLLMLRKALIPAIMSIGVAGYAFYKTIKGKGNWFYVNLILVAIVVGIGIGANYYHLLSLIVVVPLVIANNVFGKKVEVSRERFSPGLS